MTTTHHTPIPTSPKAAANAATFNAPLGQLDAAVQAAMVGSGGWATTLDGTAASGQKVVPVSSTANAVVGMPVYIGLTSGTHEVGVIDTISAGVSVTLVANLTSTYAAGTPLTATPAEVADARGGYATLGESVRGAYLDAKDYGADPTGVADSTSAIQAALNATAGTVVIPAGTFRLTNTLSILPTHRLLGAGMNLTTLVMEDDTKYAIEYAVVSTGDSAPGLVIADLAISAKFGIHLARHSGSYGAVMAPSVLRVKMTGKYITIGDVDFQTAIVPTEAYLETFGIGVRWDNTYDGVIQHCQIQHFGVCIRLEDSDINVISNNRIQGGRYIYAGTSCEQNTISENDLLTLGRVGGIYLDTGANHTTISNNYFEAPYNSGQFIRTNNDFGTLIIGNRIDNPRTTTPFFYLAPSYGCRVTENRLVPGGSPVASVQVAGTYWGSSIPVLCDWTDNQSTFPVPTSPGVLIGARDPYVISPQNMLSVGGTGSTSWPFIVSGITGRNCFQTSTYSLIFSAPLKNDMARNFLFRFTGRKITAGGYTTITYSEPLTTLWSASLGFTKTDGVETIDKVFALPAGSTGTGAFALTIGNTEVEFERIEIIPLALPSTGWTVATGTADRTTFVTSTVTTEGLAQRFMALEQDLIARGVIGS